MIENEKINELAARLAKAIPGEVKDAQHSIKQTFLKILQSGIDKMDLVTREEFTVQEKILARTREKLNALEQQLADLEKRD